MAWIALRADSAFYAVLFKYIETFSFHKDKIYGIVRTIDLKCTKSGAFLCKTDEIFKKFSMALTGFRHLGNFLNIYFGMWTVKAFPNFVEFDWVNMCWTPLMLVRTWLVELVTQEDSSQDASHRVSERLLPVLPLTTLPTPPPTLLVDHSVSTASLSISNLMLQIIVHSSWFCCGVVLS